MDLEPPSLLILSVTSSFVWYQAIILVVLLAFSALISGAEVALFGLSFTDLKKLQDEDTKKGILINKLLEKPKKLLATILIANNAVNICIVLLFNDLGQVFFSTIDAFIFGIIPLRLLLEIVLATVLILIIGEIIPKVYANRNRISFAQSMAIPIHFLNILFTPLNMPMRRATLFLEEKLGRKTGGISLDQLSQALELTDEGDTTSEEKKILEGIVNFGNTDTKQVMCPRIDIFGLEEEMKFPEVIQLITEHGFSRIPVFKENLDTVIGVLYTKDLLPYLNRKSFNWLGLIRPPFFVPENKKLDDLLLEFQLQKIHLAIVVDEYGGTSGIVTLEDIIEEIVGDISDEFDDEDLVYSKLDDYTYIFEGKTNVRDFYKVIKLADDLEDRFENQKGESETLAGLLLEIFEAFPKNGEKITFEGFEFIIESVDKKRLKQIKVILPRET